MDYVGIDPAVGLECSSCKHVSRMPYSELLDHVLNDIEVRCDNCERCMSHDWTTVTVVQNIIKRRMRQVNEAKEKRLGYGG